MVQNIHVKYSRTDIVNVPLVEWVFTIDARHHFFEPNSSHQVMLQEKEQVKRAVPNEMCILGWYLRQERRAGK